jgi:DNA-binding response OmpR family regulator
MASHKTRKEAPFEDLRFLVVEDDPELRSSLYLGLLLQGMTGDTAADGKGGLNLAMKRTYDVILTDFHLPGINGIELIQKIPRRRGTPRIILMSSCSDPQVTEGAMAAGACRVLSKPIRLKALVKVVHEVVRNEPPVTRVRSS